MSSSTPQPILPTTGDRVYANDTYILPADAEELERLERTHKLLMHAYRQPILGGYSPTQGDRIVDSGTGTGSWPIEVANTAHPQVELFAFDISSRLFPAGAPADRIHFRTQSILDAPPAEWLSSFNLVHQRLLGGGLLAKDWPIALSNIHKMLKPGSYVQLGEFGRMNGGPAIKCFSFLFDSLFSARGLLRSAMAEIPTMLIQAGFSDVQRHPTFLRWGRSADNAEMMKQALMALIDGMKIPILKSGGFGVVKTEADFDELVKEIQAEYETMDDGGMEFEYFVARKPE
ncbi:S-adenosyl-L-methionine-dependent methyltransferase [Flagelloscypha sp. PMI_526]|nr:S-adenosyl-L-methionine-dependent methyltransferase [Flagelloscypha sp. PMI_526]